MTDYAYRGAGRSLTPEQAAAAMRRNGLATSQQARVALPAPGETPPAALKGAVKVDGFPRRCKYPFKEIAADGGVWKIDPAAFGVRKVESIRTQACAWARDHGMTAKTVVEGGQIYVQFTRGRGK